MRIILKLVLTVFISIASSVLNALDDPIVTINPQNYSFEGITPAGLKKLKELRDALRTHHRLFQNNFKSLSAVEHAAYVARAFKGNMFLYGPPGGAKSALVHWIFDGENEPAFQIQMNQMMTEQAFVGGQNFEKAKLGEFEVNTKGSLADFKVALIDEAEKGNPAALAALLSLLNERKILAGNQVIDAKTETVFATSNSNLPEIKQHFIESGQRSTADAFLNRFHFKCFVYNWLSQDDQIVLDERRQKRRYLEALLAAYPAVYKDEVFLSPPKIDWPALRLFANTLLAPSELFMVAFRNFVNEMRSETNKAVRRSEELHKQNRYTEPFVYHPSCDYTERVRQQVPEIVLMSALIDFLLSDLADDEHIELETSKQIELGPLSLWRSYLMLTTIGQGSVGLAKDQENQKVTIQFAVGIDESEARDEREQSLIRALKNEQERFSLLFTKQMADIQESIKGGVPYLNDPQEMDKGEELFELRMLKK